MGQSYSEQTSNRRIKPLYMWAGGKSKLLKHYKDKIPARQYSSYIEPFFGGGAVFCHIANESLAGEFILNDVNQDLMDIHRSIKSDCTGFIERAVAISDKWNSLPSAQRKAWYYQLRADFWTMDKENNNYASTLYVLMKTGFNGLWQPNKEQGGKYGTAVGLVDKDARIDPSQIRLWANKLSKATIHSSTYKDIAIPSTPSLIYCDPPYRSSFADYGQGFTDTDHIELIQWCKKQAERGHTVLLANRDCGDGFFTSHLDGASVHLFEVFYTIGRKKKTESGYQATKASEFVAIFHPPVSDGDIELVVSNEKLTAKRISQVQASNLVSWLLKDLVPTACVESRRRACMRCGRSSHSHSPWRLRHSTPYRLRHPTKQGVSRSSWSGWVSSSRLRAPPNLEACHFLTSRGWGLLPLC